MTCTVGALWECNRATISTPYIFIIMNESNDICSDKKRGDLGIGMERSSRTEVAFLKLSFMRVKKNVVFWGGGVEGYKPVIPHLHHCMHAHWINNGTGVGLQGCIPSFLRLLTSLLFMICRCSHSFAVLLDTRRQVK